MIELLKKLFRKPKPAPTKYREYPTYKCAKCDKELPMGLRAYGITECAEHYEMEVKESE
jgi:hypothetical protein